MQNIPTKLRILLGLLVLLGLIIGGTYFLPQFKNTKNPSMPEFTTPSAEDTKNLGLKAAQKLLDDYPQFVKKAFIQQQIEGKLQAKGENSWTLEKEGQTIILINQGTNKVFLSRLPKIASGSSKPVVYPVEIKEEDLEIGDLVSVNQMIDWKSGRVMVTGITVLSE